MHSIYRIIKFSLQDLGRNFGLSTMTVFILILMLLSVNVLWGVDILTKQATSLVKEQINISLYFKAETTDKNLEEVQKYLSVLPEITEMNLVTRDQVLDSFKNRHKLSSEVLSALEELKENPFGPTLIIKTREPQDYKKILQAVDVPEYDALIETKSFEGNEEGIEKIQNITNRIEKIGFGLSALFAIISFLIIFNTIRVSIYTQRIEISIKRLVGASSWFIRGPYMVEAFIFALLSVSITFGLIYLALHFLDPYLSIVFSNGFTLTNYYNSHIILLTGIQFVSVLLLTFISSGLAMRKQLKV
ncbi:MAG TPA: permease-like cell division protein FtsX [Candidatus Magasanikbacteria bacterium]|nr:permease-like cell division protein FtsX [Candidatus Magasanikbacteria bacterium]